MAGATQYQENLSAKPQSERKGVVRDRTVLDKAAAVSRRNFLGKALTTIGTLASWRLGNKLADTVSGNSEEMSRDAGGVTVEPVAKDGALADKPFEVIKYTDFLSKVYPNSTPEDLAAKIRETEIDMGSKLQEEELSRADGYIRAIKNVTANSALGAVPEIQDLLFGLVIAESSGKQFAVSKNDKGEVIAKGPVQITDPIAEAHQMKMSDDESDERFDKNKSLEVAAGEISEAFGYWKDLGMALWEWHAGRTQLQGIVDLYLRDNFAGETQNRTEAFPAKLAQYKLDAHKILSNKVVDAKLKESNSDWDSTQKFLYRVVTGSLAYKRRTSALARSAT